MCHVCVTYVTRILFDWPLIVRLMLPLLSGSKWSHQEVLTCKGGIKWSRFLFEWPLIPFCLFLKDGRLSCRQSTMLNLLWEFSIVATKPSTKFTSGFPHWMMTRSKKLEPFKCITFFSLLTKGLAFWCNCYKIWKTYPSSSPTSLCPQGNLYWCIFIFQFPVFPNCRSANHLSIYGPTKSFNCSLEKKYTISTKFLFASLFVNKTDTNKSVIWTHSYIVSQYWLWKMQVCKNLGHT